MAINVFPIHDQILLKDADDPTCGGLFPDGQGTNDQVRAGRGTVVKCGKGLITKSGLIPLCIKPGDDVIFMVDAALTFQSNGDTYHLLPEWSTSALLNRDPHAEEIGEFNGIDMDKLMDNLVNPESGNPEIS